MSHYFGIRPWELEKLTYDEINHYRDALMEIQKDLSRASR